MPHQSQTNPPHADHQGLLAASRRIDWRFLLSDPRLGRVALVGHVDPSLREALGLLSEEVVGQGESADLTVVRGAGPRELARAAQLVPPGGWLYAELRRPRAAPGRAFALLRGLGFGELAAHWHHPDFERCTEIVPLSNEEVLRHALSRRGSRLKALLARLALETGLLARVVPSVSVLGRRRASGVDLQPHNAALSLLLSEPDVDVSPATSSLLLTPRFAASRHVVFLLFGPHDEVPSLVAKMPRLSGDVGGIEREALSLRALDRLWEGGFDGAPRVVFFDNDANRAVLAETALTGTSMTPAEVRRAPDRCLDAVAGLLMEIGAAQARAPAQAARWFERLLEEPLRRLAASFDSGDETALVERTLGLLSPLREAELPFVLEHGDVSHPNLILLGSGRAGLIDWELSEPHGLPAHDLFFFLEFFAFSVAPARAAARRTAVFAETFFGARVPYAKTILAYAERVGVPSSLLHPLFVACWARCAAGLPLRLRTTREERGAPSAQSIRGHRYYDLWRYTVEHAGKLLLPGNGGV